jgi:hypothetical protein
MASRNGIFAGGHPVYLREQGTRGGEELFRSVVEMVSCVVSLLR